MPDLDVVVRKLRRQRGWTQGQLAVHSGVSRGSIALIETGERETPNIETMSKLAAALRVSVDHILIEAGFIEAPENPGHLSPSEQDLIASIRSIQSEEIRMRTLQSAIMLANLARDAETASARGE